MRYNTRAEVENIGRAGSCLWLDAPEGFAARYLSSFWLYLERDDEAFTPHAADGFWEAWITCWMSKQFENHERFIDIGANVGYYSMMAAKAGLLTAAVEPNPALVRMLWDTAALNNIFRNFEVVDVALSDGYGEISLVIPEGHSGGAYIAESGGVTVPVRKFDDYFAFARNQNVLIKIDAEGAEPKIWAGMQRYFSENNCTVILEWETVRFDAEAFAKELLAEGKNHVWYVDFAGNEIPLVHWRQIVALPGLQMVVVRKAA